MKVWKQGVLFYLGGGGYMALEFLWRGRSHWSMFLLGGLCFCLLGGMVRRFPGIPLAGKVILGAGIVTLLELAAGFLVNRNYAVWDYRNLPGNLAGQICLPYTLLWMPVCLGAMLFYEKAERRIDHFL